MVEQARFLLSSFAFSHPIASLFLLNVPNECGIPSNTCFYFPFINDGIRSCSWRHVSLASNYR
ncbi:hypothetical protein EPI10_026809 [Gossypium australe]|uniref:Uncharacterized protein n=1 Tax=Gossypium australe TaxID=47621 RepID=A0A5B6UPS5_9ROSI|nr:hypothetical protein EPI10_026809 [Gossypium australe]